MYYRRRRPRRFLRLFLFVTVSGICIYFISSFIHATVAYFQPPIKIINPLGKSLPRVAVLSSSTELSDIVDKELDGSKGTYAVVIKNFKTGERYYKNEHVVFEPASLYKLWVMTTAFLQIEKGTLKKEEMLQSKIETLNDKFDIASESAELSEGDISMSVDAALRQMITISHNYAALLLASRVKLASIREFLTSQNFDESKLGQPPKTTASDIALFFEKLYKKELASDTSTDEMLSLLRQQKLNNKLPKLLADDVVIAHKTGELGMFTHDAGIVTLPNGDYLIVVLSKSTYPPGAEERIARISKAVYEYFSKKK